MSDAVYEPLQTLPLLAGTVDRRRYLVEQATGRRVLHLGCVDDRLTETRLRSGVLLHEQLMRVATELTGVDISEPGIALLRVRVPGRYEVGNVERLDDVPVPDAVDLVIASELIEHLPNPGRFLAGLGRLLERTGASALITTPNAYSWAAFAKLAVRRREATHPDHVLLYSPYTLVHALQGAGLRVEALHMHDWERGGGGRDCALGAIAGVARRWNPYLGVGLVARVAAG